MKALQEVTGSESEAVFKSASGLGGGIGLRGSACGALVGGSLFLGQIFGRSYDTSEREKADKTYALCSQFYQWFKEEFKSPLCRGIIKIDLTDPEKRKEFLTSSKHEECAQMTAKAAAYLAQTVGKESQ